MDIVDNRALKIKVKNPERITSLISKSKQLAEISPGVHEVLVHWGLHEAQLLNNLKLKNVPSPIRARYNWPGTYKPFDHQRVVSEFLTLNRRAFCFSEQGTMKTSSVLWAVDYLMKQQEIKRMLVVCPVSIMKPVWVNDAFKTIMHRKIAIAHGTRDQRLAVINGPYEIVVINYDGVPMMLEQLRGKFDLIVLDEANAVKNVQTTRWKSISSLVTPKTWLWLMTGTPAAQSPVDAYGLARLVCPQRVPQFFSAWQSKVMRKISLFRFVPVYNASDIVHQTLQPSIRFTKEECLDLPEMTYQFREVPLTAQQLKYYKAFKKEMMINAAGEQITAVHAAAQLNKLLQLSCIAYNTPVLTNCGWVPIQDITTQHTVWDGCEFVTHGGLLPRGIRRVVELDGVRMTPDHEVLTVKGWRTAGELLDVEPSNKLNRASVRLPDGYPEERIVERRNNKGAVAVPVYMRSGSNTREPKLAIQTSPQRKALRMQNRRSNSYARYDTFSPVSHMDEHAPAVPIQRGQGLEELRRARRNSVQSLAISVREFLGRYAARLFGHAIAGSNRCKWKLRTDELSVGYHARTSKQHEVQPYTGNPARNDDVDTSGGSVRIEESNTICQTNSIRMEHRTCADNAASVEVFDIASAGPRHRFVVQGAQGQLLIVHNCGCVYADNGEVIRFDADNRILELINIIEEASKKVIVFVPFRHAINAVVDRLTETGYTVHKISGEVPASQRAVTIDLFQTAADPRVLVIQPQSAAHGITLTAADTVVWFGPTHSVETYLQGNARVHRNGQTSCTTVIKLCGSEVERKVYDAVEKKEMGQATLMALYEDLTRA